MRSQQQAGIGHTLRDFERLHQKSQAKSFVRGQQQAEGQAGIPKEETCSRAVSISSASDEDSLAFSYNSCLQGQPDADSIIDLYSHDELGPLNEKSTETSATREQIMQLALTTHTDSWTVPPTDLADFEMLCGDVSSARRHSNIDGGVQPTFLLDVPVRDIYMDFVNDDIYDYVGFVSEKKTSLKSESI